MGIIMCQWKTHVNIVQLAIVRHRCTSVRAIMGCVLKCGTCSHMGHGVVRRSVVITSSLRGRVKVMVVSSNVLRLVQISCMALIDAGYLF